MSTETILTIVLAFTGGVITDTVWRRFFDKRFKQAGRRVHAALQPKELGSRAWRNKMCRLRTANQRIADIRGNDNLFDEQVAGRQSKTQAFLAGLISTRDGAKLRNETPSSDIRRMN